MAKIDPDKVARWYKQGLWSDKMVDDAVSKGVLTKAQATKIKKAGPKND